MNGHEFLKDERYKILCIKIQVTLYHGFYHPPEMRSDEIGEFKSCPRPEAN